jgi:hypothetical protein
MQCIAVHAEFSGSLALISSFAPQNSQHESFLEFTDGLVERIVGEIACRCWKNLVLVTDLGRAGVVLRFCRLS